MNNGNISWKCLNKFHNCDAKARAFSAMYAVGWFKKTKLLNLFNHQPDSDSFWSKMKNFVWARCSKMSFRGRSKRF